MTMMTSTTTTFSLLLAFCFTVACHGFATTPPSLAATTTTAPLRIVTTERFMSDNDDDLFADASQDRIKGLVDENPVLLFMKGTQLFPQCGFSNTAVQILNTFNIDYHSVDVLADEGIRSGVKDFSQWPTIPQLYVDGEFIGGCDIMIEMYQSGELGELIEKVAADAV